MTPVTDPKLHLSLRQAGQIVRKMSPDLGVVEVADRIIYADQRWKSGCFECSIHGDGWSANWRQTSKGQATHLDDIDFDGDREAFERDLILLMLVKPEHVAISRV